MSEKAKQTKTRPDLFQSAGTTPADFMAHAYREAQKAYQKDETPVGAILVKDGKIIARAHNLRERRQDPCAHAEVLVIQKAAKKLGTWRLSECELYVTLEPCAMCAGAIVHARLSKVVIGAMDPKAGACGSVVDLLQVAQFNHQVPMVGGVMATECGAILKDFFKSLRERKKHTPKA